MRATIWGCRGSLATPGPATVGYGGNTSSVELRTAAGGLVVLDAGTGIRPLGLTLAAEPIAEIHLLLTHLHLDHVEGLGFFAPLFDPGCRVTIRGPRPEAGSLRDQLTAYLSPPFFPVPFDELPSRIEILEIWDDRWTIDGLSVVSAPVRHRGRTVGYRIEEGGRALGFIPDNEPGLDAESGRALAAGVDLLLHDAQYTAEEYATRVGWGHTSLPDLAAFVDAAGPRRTLMFHHDPSHSDAVLEEMERRVRELAGRDDIELAREGTVVTI